jgi:hypothetical protein
MHAGNKYFYAGEFNTNECAVYINNTAEGFGSITFNGTIFEFNSLALYCYNTSVMITPVSFKDVWFESNASASVTIDSWSGTTVTTQTVTGGNTILDGNNGVFDFNTSFFSDCQVKANDAQVNVNGCRSERESGVNGKNSVITGTNSTIVQNNCYGDLGPSLGTNMYSTGFTKITRDTIDSSPTNSSNRSFTVMPRGSKIASYGPSLAFSAPLTTAASTTGTFALTGTVVSDGLIYNQCNEFTRASFTTAQFTQLSTPNSAITTSVGYYVFTIDLKVISGNVNVNVWDRNTKQFVTVFKPSTEWQTLAGIGYADSAFSMFLDFQGANETTTWRVSAYQIHRFNTRAQAQAFLNSGVFAES